MPTPTIVQIQAAIDAKADARQIINMIADYLQGNTGGGGVTLYSGDGSLASDRTVDLNGNVLHFTQGSTDFLSLEPTPGVENVILQANNNTGGGNQGTINVFTDDLTAQAALQTQFNGFAKFAVIGFLANATTSTLSYEADTHTFNGVINLPLHANPTPQDGDVWRVDNTNTGLKIRINGVTKTITVS